MVASHQLSGKLQLRILPLKLRKNSLHKLPAHHHHHIGCQPLELENYYIWHHRPQIYLSAARKRDRFRHEPCPLAPGACAAAGVITVAYNELLQLPNSPHRHRYLTMFPSSSSLIACTTRSKILHLQALQNPNGSSQNPSTIAFTEPPDTRTYHHVRGPTYPYPCYLVIPYLKEDGS